MLIVDECWSGFFTNLAGNLNRFSTGTVKGAIPRPPLCRGPDKKEEEKW